MPVVYNSLCWGTSHAPFDAALVCAAHAAFAGEPVAFLGAADHLAEVSRLVPAAVAATVAWIPIDIMPRSDKRLPQRLHAEWRLLGRALRQAARDEARVVIAAAGSPAIFLAASRLALRRHRNTTVALVHHGALGGMLTSRRLTAYLRVADRSGARQIVLGESIRRNLVSQSGAWRHLAAIHHPYLFPHVAPGALQSPVRFGFFGLASHEKGFAIFCALAAELGPASGATFELIGSLAPEWAARLPPGGDQVLGTAAAGPLSRGAYEQRVAAVHYAVMPYSARHYRMVGSGSVLDALAFGKPIIAVRNDLLQSIFDELGEVGYLCDDREALRAQLDAVVRHPPVADYRRQVANIMAGRHRFAPEAVARELVAALS